jgi:hypothetical protein
MRDLTDNVRARFSEFALNKFNETLKTGDILNAIVNRAKQEVTAQVAKDAMDEALRNVCESQQRVLAIQTELSMALEKASRASQTVMLLETLRGVLTVAQIIDLAVQELRVKPEIFPNGSTFDHVLTTTNNIKQDAELAGVKFQTAFDGSVTNFEIYLDLLRQKIEDLVQPPPFVDQYLKLHKK